MISLLLGLLAASNADVVSIRSLRARSNGAIAAHDLSRLEPLQAPNYTIIPGSSGTPLDARQFAGRIAAAFQDPTFITYVRTPDRIQVSSSRKRAGETGTWLGTWRKPDGIMRLGGVYQATWVPTRNGWQLLNESFISLSCTGSRSCADVD